nr:MAG TPA: hypothetical protein [Caudoviricetes sp.]
MHGERIVHPSPFALLWSKDHGRKFGYEYRHRERFAGNYLFLAKSCMSTGEGMIFSARSYGAGHHNGLFRSDRGGYTQNAEHLLRSDCGNKQKGIVCRLQSIDNE